MSITNLKVIYRSYTMSFAKTFDSVNARSLVVGAELFLKIAEAKDITTLRRIRDEAAKTLEGMAEIVGNKADFAEWHAFFIKANEESIYHEIDTTGEFTRLVEEIKTLNAEGYYFTTVRPLMVKSVQALKDESVMILAGLDIGIKALAEQRRAEMHVVN